MADRLGSDSGEIKSIGLWGGLVLIGVGLLAIWWLYDVWKEIVKRIREWRKTLNALDDCLEQYRPEYGHEPAVCRRLLFVVSGALWTVCLFSKGNLDMEVV